MLVVQGSQQSPVESITVDPRLAAVADDGGSVGAPSCAAPAPLGNVAVTGTELVLLVGQTTCRPWPATSHVSSGKIHSPAVAGLRCAQGRAVRREVHLSASVSRLADRPKVHCDLPHVHRPICEPERRGDVCRHDV
jgi:hypothetical protein